MSEADKMFEELGYKHKRNVINGQYCSYTNEEYYKDEIDKENEHIIFDNYSSTICFIGKNKGKNMGSRYGNGIPIYKDMFIPAITTKELKAINKKVEELGWND